MRLFKRCPLFTVSPIKCPLRARSLSPSLSLLALSLSTLPVIRSIYGNILYGYLTLFMSAVQFPLIIVKCANCYANRKVCKIVATLAVMRLEMLLTAREVKWLTVAVRGV